MAHSAETVILVRRIVRYNLSELVSFYRDALDFGIGHASQEAAELHSKTVHKLSAAETVNETTKDNHCQKRAGFWRREVRIC